MTPKQIALVQTSFKSVAPIASKAADLFYDRLFETAPEVRSMFPADLSGQKVKLIAMLGTAVNNLHQLDVILPAVRDLGSRHRRYGVTTEHYAPVGAALLWTLEQGLGSSFTTDVKRLGAKPTRAWQVRCRALTAGNEIACKSPPISGISAINQPRAKDGTPAVSMALMGDPATKIF